MSYMTAWSDKESKNLEFKLHPPKGDQLTQTCVAFANGSGGEIIVGIEDTTGEVRGVADALATELLTSLPNAVYDAVSPPLLPHVSLQNIAGRTIVRVQVYPGSRKPYFITSLGPEKGVYIRAGASTRRAHPEAIADLIREGRNITFDEEASGYQLESLSPALLSEFYGGPYLIRQLITDKVAVRLPANPDIIEVTWGGLLFFSENPEAYLSEAHIICSRFRGTSGREIIQTADLFGPIPVLAISTQRLLEEWLAREVKIVGVKREASIAVPLVALRETIINALVHRKYTVAGPIKIALFEDRLEIFSPGTFPGLISLKTLGDGTTVLRNPRIAQFARKLGLVEKLGSGIRSVMEACYAANLEAPRYEEGPDFVKVTFSFQERTDKIRTLDETIQALLDKGNELLVDDLIECRPESRNTITRRLNHWIAQGLLVRIGKGRGTKYRKAGA